MNECWRWLKAHTYKRALLSLLNWCVVNFLPRWRWFPFHAYFFLSIYLSSLPTRKRTKNFWNVRISCSPPSWLPLEVKTLLSVRIYCLWRFVWEKSFRLKQWMAYQEQQQEEPSFAAWLPPAIHCHLSPWGKFCTEGEQQIKGSKKCIFFSPKVMDNKETRRRRRGCET